MEDSLSVRAWEPGGFAGNVTAANDVVPRPRRQRWTKRGSRVGVGGLETAADRARGGPAARARTAARPTSPP